MYIDPRHVRLAETTPLPSGPEERWNTEGTVLPSVAGADLGEMPWTPPVDFIRDSTRYTLFIDLPGVKKSNIHVEFQDGILYVHGGREHEAEVQDEDNIHYLLERRCGAFMRHVHLDTGIIPDQIQAEYKLGILKVIIPRDEKAATKNVSIKVN